MCVKYFWDKELLNFELKVHKLNQSMSIVLPQQSVTRANNQNLNIFMYSYIDTYSYSFTNAET